MTTPIAPPTAATGTGGISTDSSRLSSRANLEAAGKRFEAVFDNMMLKSMREAKLSDDLFDSKALDTFEAMQDQQVAQTMAEHQPIGIGKAMVDFLSKSQSTLQGDAPSGDADAGPSAGDPAAIGGAS